MRTIQFTLAQVMDWKDCPQVILNAVDEQLAEFGLEVVMAADTGDAVVWRIEKRNAQ